MVGNENMTSNYKTKQNNNDNNDNNNNNNNKIKPKNLKREKNREIQWSCVARELLLASILILLHVTIKHSADLTLEFNCELSYTYYSAHSAN